MISHLIFRINQITRMKSKITLLMLSLVMLASCSSNDDASQPVNTDPVTGNKLLMLKVDYLTNEFEGGTELTFDDLAETFTIAQEYMPPGDFGNLKLYYDELDVKIFDGDIIWMGLGTLYYPDNFQPAASFDHVLTDDYITPAEGFENVFNPQAQTYDYNGPWSHVQGLVKVRQYLQTNPDASVKLFLYTPSVGIGNPADWDWIIMLKN